MPAPESASTPRAPFDCSSVVRARVTRACQSPLHSLFREEVTRQGSAVCEARAGAAPQKDATAAPCVADDGAGTLFFPFRNGTSSAVSRAAVAQVPECVTLIGGTGFFGKFVAEQYLHRGISVTVLARDVEKAKSIFVPIASGEREERAKASKGFVPMPGHASPRLVGKSSTADESGRRMVLSYSYASTTQMPSAALSSSSLAPEQQRVTLEIVEGDVNSREDVEFAVRRASLVYYLAPALEEAYVADDQPKKKWYKVQSYFPSQSSASGASYGGFLRSFDACRRVDAHFVSLTPLWVHGSRLSPVFWYRRLVTHPRGYIKAVISQEQNLLGSTGSPSPRCYFGTEHDANELLGTPSWKHWWSILSSTRLPDDLENVPRSPVRFSLFRLSDIVYPAFNTRMAAVKNNRVDCALHVHNIDTGDLDARLLAGVLAKTLALCSSIVESRIDIGGRLRGDVDMRDTAAVLDLFTHFRNE